jgi:membrane-associated phospholipid phosphatase
MTRRLRRSFGFVLAVLLASIGAVVALSRPAAAATATTDTVFYWNNVLLEAFRRQGGPPAPLSRAAAIMHAAIFDVINNVQWIRVGGAYEPYAFFNSGWDPAIDDDLTIGIAARDLLIFALPAQQAFVQQKFTERYGTASQAAAVNGAAQVVTTYQNLRSNDGSGASATYVFDNVPGAWRLTGNLCTAPGTPQWGLVTPFISGSGSVRPPLPGGYTTYASLLASSLYASNFNEVTTLGRADSTSRTPEQTTIAWFWANDLDGTYKPPGQLLDLTRSVATAKFTGTTAALLTARLFALTSLALADAAIAAWDRKYDTPIDLWRPETAIHLADSDNNSATAPDTSWQPLSADRSGAHFSPCFPAWISGHATFGGAWAGVMRGQFGDSFTFTATTEDPHAVGVTRTFTSFTAAATEIARSRVYLGVHYPFDGDDGLSTGLSIGGLTVDLFLHPRD